MTTKERGVVSDAPSTSRRHAAPIDAQPTAEELLFEVFRLTHPILKQAREVYGRVPAPGTAGWRAAPDSAKVAGLLTLSGEYLLADADHAAEKLKAAGVAISQAYDWASAAGRLSYAQLAARRTEPGPMAREVHRAAAARWAATGCSQEVPAT